ncbi:type VII secretion system-associated protein [Streptomyces sp. NPDC001843]|uniref:type VII secretion system-associated protein n=1 Tax=Streptomyces sp. NPDC001843 TaxID=3364617 RepID=UPI0036C8D329
MNANLTHLDSAALTAFADHDVATFHDDLKKLDADSDAPSMKGLRDGTTTAATEGLVKPLAIGLMAKDEGGHIDGVDFTKAVGGGIDALVTILDQQKKLFTDIEANLRTTVSELLKTQGSNLAEIKAEDFMKGFSDVDGDFDKSSGSGGGGKQQ